MDNYDDTPGVPKMMRLSTKFLGRKNPQTEQYLQMMKYFDVMGKEQTMLVDGEIIDSAS